MSETSCCSEKTRNTLAWAVGILGSFAVIGVLAYRVSQQNQASTTALDAARAAERSKALAEVQASAKDILTQYKMEDPNKGWVRLPIDRAMEIVSTEWKDPAAGREKLLKRHQNSTNVVSFE